MITGFMRKTFGVIFAFLFIISCKKDNVSLLSEYQDIVGAWNTQSISWDSLGTRVTYSIPYDILVIYDDLSYAIFMNIFNPVENGTINIVTQSSATLEIFFAAKYPDYSSFAGSHIFGVSNVVLVSLTGDEMVLRSVDQGIYPVLEYTFRR
jgi:hypothetical protein